MANGMIIITSKSQDASFVGLREYKDPTAP